MIITLSKPRRTSITVVFVHFCYPNIELNSSESSFRVGDEFFGFVAFFVVARGLLPHEHVGE